MYKGLFEKYFRMANLGTRIAGMLEPKTLGISFFLHNNATGNAMTRRLPHLPRGNPVRYIGSRRLRYTP